MLSCAPFKVWLYELWDIFMWIFVLSPPPLDTIVVPTMREKEKHKIKLFFVFSFFLLSSVPGRKKSGRLIIVFHEPFSSTGWSHLLWLIMEIYFLMAEIESRVIYDWQLHFIFHHFSWTFCWNLTHFAYSSTLVSFSLMRKWELNAYKKEQFCGITSLKAFMHL